MKQAELFMYKQALNVVSGISPRPHSPKCTYYICRSDLDLKLYHLYQALASMYSYFLGCCFIDFKKQSFYSFARMGQIIPALAASACTRFRCTRIHLLFTEAKQWVLIIFH